MGPGGSVRHVLRSKFPLLTVSLALPLAAIGAGCTTFSDSDAVARVDDAELTRDEFEAELTELGATDDTALDAEPVRGVITTWIVEQLAALPIEADELRAVYEQGAAASGAVCLSAIVVEDEAAATLVAADIESGTAFADAFAASNLDEQLAATAGALPCITGSDLEEPIGVPFLAAAVELTVDDPLAVAPLLDDAGAEIAWAVVQVRPFDELTAEDTGVLTGIQNGDVDIYVDPRYGTFDRTSSRVVALG